MRKGKRIRAAAICLTALFAVYTVFVYFLVSACLVPSFMDRLNAFEDITRKCYAEQVQTSDIQENQSRFLSDTAKWLETSTAKNCRQDGGRLYAGRGGISRCLGE